MTTRDIVENEYFNWLCGLISEKRRSKEISYRKLLAYLHNTEFIYSIPRDGSRAADGLNLRYRFTYDYTSGDPDDINLYLNGPCSVLEMMVALAIRCEEQIMDDPVIGNRTGQWFWGMIVNLGLGSMTDNRFIKSRVEEIVYRFLNREYEPNGKGGLFTVKNAWDDMRDVEIWYQLCWYLDSIT